MSAHRTRRLLLLLPVIFLLLLARGDDPTGVEPRPADQVAGGWAWVSTFRLWPAETPTPLTEGYSQTLVLGADGRYALRRWGELGVQLISAAQLAGLSPAGAGGRGAGASPDVSLSL